MMKVELLAPGGSYESVLAAFNAGADAVYTAGNMFGARAGADNLTQEQLIDVIHYAHIHGKKLYLTVNTLLKDDEIEKHLYDYLAPLYENGLDAVIVQDMGVLLFLKNQFPNLHLHASTQMTVFGIDTVKELQRLGVSRIVTPREFSIEEIKDIKKNSTLEIESFVHGALCYCYSGQCFLSSYIGGRSGNRGRCAQPCRMEYDVLLDGKVLNSGNRKYILSPKDICTLKILPDIIEAGVFSLKIEGRMKKTEYVAGVVQIYRKYLDQYLKKPKHYHVDEKDIKLLGDLFQRNGFHESYYHQHNGANMISLKKPEFRKENSEFTEYLKKEYTGKKLKRALNLTVKCIKDRPIEIFTVIEKTEICVQGNKPVVAERKPLDEATIRKQIGKTGNTDFIIQKMNIVLEDNLFVPIGELNKLRRDFLEQVQKSLLQKYQKKAKKEQIDTNCSYETDKININVSVWDREQLQEVIRAPFIESIYLELCGEIGKDLKKSLSKIQQAGKQALIAMPYVFRKKDKEIFEKKYLNLVALSDGVLIRNQEQYFYLVHKGVENKYIFDYNVYTNNRYSKQYYLRKTNVTTTVPLELNIRELKKRGITGEEFILYGYMPAMISAGCALKTCGSCFKENRTYEIKDRLNNRFTTRCVCEYCYNLMYNCKPLSLFSYYKDIEAQKPASVRISFTIENRNQVKEILNKMETTFVQGSNIVEDDKTTRGHFKRGVL